LRFSHAQAAGWKGRSGSFPKSPTLMSDSQLTSIARLSERLFALKERL
jgi:hypothetical protein